MGSFLSRGFNPDTDLPDLTGKVILVTGGKCVWWIGLVCISFSDAPDSSGIGLVAIQQLARHGAKVYMGARNEEKAQAAIEKLHAEGLGPGNGTPIYHKLDLANPKDAKESAEEFLKREERLDILGMY